MPALETTKRGSVLIRLPHLLPVVVGVAMLGLGWWFGISPQWPSQTEAAAAAALREARGAMQAQLNDLGNLTREYRELSATDLRRLDIALPTEADIPSLLAQLEGLVAQSRVELTNLTIDQTSALPQAESAVIRNEAGEVVGVRTGVPSQLSWEPAELQVNLTLGALSYAELKTFVAALEQSLKLFRLTSFAFGADKTAGGYAFNLSTPYLLLR